MDELIRFVWVEFPNDPNVAGIKYWYSCDDKTASIGDEVIAPLGRHNNLQQGIIRDVQMGDEFNAPFPLYLIKSIKSVIKK
jgi:hypothetical protein